MRIILFIISTLALSLLLLSCSLPLEREVTVILPSYHPYESSGVPLWYRLYYYDGYSVKSCVLDADGSRFKVKVKRGGLRLFAAKVFDELSPYGGYYEGGGDTQILLRENNGRFIYFLITAAECESEPVSRLSMSYLERNGLSFDATDHSAFTDALFDGNLNIDKLSYYKRYELTLTGLAAGYWISDTSLLDSFSIGALEERTLKLFPGSYHLYNRKEDILMTMAISETGVYYYSLSRLSKYAL